MVRTFICVNNYLEENLLKKDIMYVMNVIVPSSKIVILNLNDSFGNSLKEDTNSWESIFTLQGLRVLN